MSIRSQSFVVFVVNLEESRIFYEHLLGMQVYDEHTTSVEYHGGITLWQVHHAYDTIFHRPATGVVRLGANNCELRFITDDLELIKQRLAITHPECILSPDQGIAKTAILRLTDPDGHLICIEESLPLGLPASDMPHQTMMAAVECQASE